MDHVLGLKCVLCGAEYAIDEVDYVCPKHGDEGILDVVYDYPLIGRRLTREGLSQDREFTIWRYKPLLPVAPDSPVPPLTVGWTPLYQADRLANTLGLTRLWIKDDGRQPTASFKDRASAVGVVRAQELGRKVITAASTGNAASSLAGVCASVGLSPIIFVPATAPQAKVAQLLLFGARVLAVQGTYDQAFDLCLAASREYGWYSRNTAYNPYLSEGKKTAALEICEQLGWEAPDRILVSVGDGCIIGGLWKGLKDLLALGFIDRLPKLMGIQAEGSAVLYHAWQSGTETITPVAPTTLADSISVGIPRDRIKALRAVRETGGEYVTVSDEEILAAMRNLARGAAVFAEPAGATAYAGLVKLAHQGRIKPHERVVVLVTGNGLKDIAGAMKATAAAVVPLEPTVEALQATVARLLGL
ncbi:MAG: threonine synthase [Chloroflexi bacterium]|nr:threonine synthase [Chloroflexota bacterium]